MKQLLFLTVMLVLVACSNEPKPLSKEEQQAHDQVMNDNAAMDSMEKVIKQQIESVSDDSLMKVKH